jgi:hypothetical protein
VGTARRLADSHEVFKVIPDYSSDASNFLRVRAAQRLVSESLCNTIWKPFSFKGFDGDASEVLETLSGKYAEVLQDEESAWRNLTYTGLDAVFASSGTDLGVVSTAVEQVVNILGPLVQKEEMSKFQEELKRIFSNAVDVWNDMRIDRLRISVSVPLDRHADRGQDGWRTPPALNFGHQVAPTNSGMELNPWCLFPRIEAVSVDRGRMVLFPGYALFPDSSVFAKGLLERQEIEERIEQMPLSTLNSAPPSPSMTRPPLGLGIS